MNGNGSSDSYVPGSCNIGAGDVRARARIGRLGIVLTAAVAVAVLLLPVPWPTMLVAAVPAYVAAIGLLQARSRFCVGYAAAGRYGFGDAAGPTGDVEDAAEREADRLRAREINGRAARWTLAVTAVLLAGAWAVDSLA